MGLQDPWRLPLRASRPTRGEFGFNGTFHTVRDNEFILQTFEFEGAPDMVNIEYMWFEDLGDGRSRLRGRSICPNTEARDALLSSGMEGGMTEGYEKLDALLKSAVMDWTLEVVVVPVGDVDRAIAFYRDQLGFQPRSRTRRPRASCTSPN